MTKIEGRGYSPEDLRFSLFKSKEINFGTGSLVVISSQIGQARHLANIARFYTEKTGSPLFFIDRGIATTELDTLFPERIDSGTPEDVSVILACEDKPNTFIVDSILKVKSYSPNARVCVSAGGPFPMTPLFQEMFPAGIAPDLILANTITQAELTKVYLSEQSSNYPNLKLTKIPVIPIGHSDFDKKIHSERKGASSIYESLGIPQGAKIFTYIGIQDGVLEEAPNINTETLLTIVKAFTQVGSKYPAENFYIINRPHPEQKYWKNTEVGEINLPDNVRVVNMKKEMWPKIQTTDLCLASFATITTVSTVQHEVILFDGLDDSEKGTVPIYLHLPQLEGLISQETTETIKEGAAVAAHSTEELAEIVDQLLSGSGLTEQLKEAQRAMVGDYRIHKKASPLIVSKRSYLWINKFLH